MQGRQVDDASTALAFSFCLSRVSLEAFNGASGSWPQSRPWLMRVLRATILGKLTTPQGVQATDGKEHACIPSRISLYYSRLCREAAAACLALCSRLMSLARQMLVAGGKVVALVVIAVELSSGLLWHERAYSSVLCLGPVIIAWPRRRICLPLEVVVPKRRTNYGKT